MDPPGSSNAGDSAVHQRERTKPPLFRGEINFTQNFTTRSHAPYIVVPFGDPGAVATSVDFANEPHPDGWGLPRPSLIISVTGGAQDFNLKPRLEDMFTKGLTMAAKNTAAWIVTGGADAGVMSYVGKAFRHMQSSGASVPIIGIAPFRKVLFYKEMRKQGTVRYSKGNTPNTGEFTAIEPHHTHFIFVDKAPPPDKADWGTGGWGAEIDLRTDFEAKVVADFSVPKVLILVEGGPGSLDTVLKGLRSGSKVVIIEKSGRSADVIPLWKRIRDRELKEGASGARGGTANVAITESEQKLLDSFASKKADLDEICALWGLVYVFNMHEQDNFENFLYDVILSGNETFSHKVLLATEWKSEEMLKKVVKNHMSDSQASQEQIAESVSSAVFKCLLLNSPNVLSILMDYGRIASVDMRRLHLESYDADAPMRRFVDRFRFDADELAPLSQKTRDREGPQLGASSGHSHRGAGMSQELKLAKILKAVHEIAPEMFQRPVDHQGGASGHLGDGTRTGDVTSRTDNLSLPKPGDTEVIDVIVWALMNQYTDLALRLWRYAEVPIHCALYANKICKELSEYQRDPAVQKAYEKVGQEFEQMAVQVLDAYDADDQAIMALLYQWPRLSKPQEPSLTPHLGRTRLLGDINASAMHLAVSANAKSFISSQFYQISLREKWISYEGYQLPDSATNLQVVKWVLMPIWNVRHLEPLDLKAARSQGGGGHSVAVQLAADAASDDPSQSVRYSWKAATSFYKIPLVKFWTNTVLWVCFLALLVYIALSARSTQIRWPEWVFYFWLVMLYMDEFMQWRRRGGLQARLDFWNALDVVNYTTFLCWMILRIVCYVLGNDAIRWAAQEVLLLCIAMSFLRILNVFNISQTLGPLLVMIGKMVNDIIRFFYLLAVFLVSFTVVFAVITRERLHQDAHSADRMFRGNEWHKAYPDGTANLSFWCIMGEFGDSFEFMNGSKLGSVMLGAYVLVSQILMVNLLIAMMADTYGEVRDNADREWKTAQFSVVTEYLTSSQVPPPLTFLYFIESFWNLLCCCGRKRPGPIKPVLVSTTQGGANPETPVTRHGELMANQALLARTPSRGAAYDAHRSTPTLNTLRSFKDISGHDVAFQGRSGFVEDETLDLDIRERMRRSQKGMLETIDKEEQGSMVSKVSTVEQVVRHLHDLHQNGQDWMEQRINVLERSLLHNLEELKRTTVVVPNP
eukprot:jgi/Mesvir1/19284/Mv10359-RA.1